MKHLAVACGIGQIGKSSLLLNPEYGSRLTLGAILTNLDSCPVLAIQDKAVKQKE